MEQRETDELYMRRCLQLARGGMINAKPNPMVGAVIVSGGGRIIGEGYHVRCGEGHAEVNAFASVRAEDECLLPGATIYVSLEPCAHYGRTPPCADLIIKKGVRRAVVGCVDPFAKVHGLGIKKLRDAGVEVTVGVLEEECRELNSRFMTVNTRHRPYVVLKWCQSADGFMDRDFRPVMMSTPFTQMLSHRLRAECDAILVGRVTDERDSPQLNVRRWSGRDPLRVVLDSSRPFSPEADFSRPVIPQLMEWLTEKGVQSLIVEGGASTHRTFIEAGAWDELRVETAPLCNHRGTPAPRLPEDVRLKDRAEYDGNIIMTYLRANG